MRDEGPVSPGASPTASSRSLLSNMEDFILRQAYRNDNGYNNDSSNSNNIVMTIVITMRVVTAVII